MGFFHSSNFWEKKILRFQALIAVESVHFPPEMLGLRVRIDSRCVMQDLQLLCQCGSFIPKSHFRNILIVKSFQKHIGSSQIGMKNYPPNIQAKHERMFVIQKLQSYIPIITELAKWQGGIKTTKSSSLPTCVYKKIQTLI